MALSSLRPLGSRNFALVWSSALVSNVGTWIQTVALGTLVTTTTHTALWTALVLAAGLPANGPPRADRRGARRPVRPTALADRHHRGGGLLRRVLAVLVGLHDDPTWCWSCSSFLGGASGAIGFPGLPVDAARPRRARRSPRRRGAVLCTVEHGQGPRPGARRPDPRRLVASRRLLDQRGQLHRRHRGAVLRPSRAPGAPGHGGEHHGAPARRSSRGHGGAGMPLGNPADLHRGAHRVALHRAHPGAGDQRVSTSTWAVPPC